MVRHTLKIFAANTVLRSKGLKLVMINQHVIDNILSVYFFGYIRQYIR